MKKRVVICVSAIVCAVVLCVTAVICALFSATPPEVCIEGEENVNIEVFSDYRELGATLRARGGRKLRRPCSIIGGVDTSLTGRYIITYVYEYGHKQYAARRVVNVLDNAPPSIKLVGESNCTCENADLFNEPGYTASDAYDGELTDKVTVSAVDGDGYRTFIYTVTDRAGNTAKASRTVYIADVAAPAISLNGDAYVTMVQGSEYIDSGASSFDSFEGDLTARITAEGAVDTGAPGTYYVKYTVSDSAGHVSSVTRTVRVAIPEEAYKSIVYLTFDDGPSVSVTTRILDILAANNVKATFFLINYDSPEKEALIKRMAAEGHTIGIHGYSHDYKAVYASEDAFMNNIYTLRDKIFATTGVAPHIIRFPGGSSNTASSFNPGVMSRLVQRVRSEGFIYYDWNVSSGDADTIRVPADKLLYNVSSRLVPERRNMVLMHDSSAKETTADALQGIIDYCKNSGYVFLPITDATPAVAHKINN